MTMTCDELADLLLEFVADGLTPDQAAAFKHHLCGCRGCEVSVESYRVLILVTRALPKADPLPDGAEKRLRAALAGHLAGGA